MASDVAVPTLGESITEATLLQWLKNEGDQVAVDEPICELESDKATVDLPAPTSGILRQIKPAGETARVGEVIARIDEVSEKREKADDKPQKALGVREHPGNDAQQKPVERNSEANASRSPGALKQRDEASGVRENPAKVAERTAVENNREADAFRSPSDRTRRVPMSNIRRRIAERMVRAAQTTAMLTTFNEIDMTAVQELRARHGEQFAEKYGVPLGLMSFFARATVLALKHFEVLNAQIDGENIVYHEHVHLGLAVSTERGLVVPVLKSAEAMSFAKIEGEIKRAAAAARDGKLSLEELSGGTFTITNGGVFGSLLSTPILNPPQSGILGMHAIQERPVGVNHEIVLRPMMYVALTYDHRLVDGKEAVSFLMRLKQLLEDPMQMILEI